jgi:hypothetical protein
MKRASRCIVFLLLSATNLFGQTKLIFRYDDFILRQDSLNESIVNTFQKYNIPLVLGVIPCDKNEQVILDNNYNYLSVLKRGVQNKSIEIALHGLNHSRIINGEFGGLKCEEQYRRMDKGKNILDSIFHQPIVSTFIPPWNAYDENTLAVMEKLGLHSISSALTVNQPLINPLINYLPCTLEDCKSVIEVLNKNKKRECIVVVMFHRYNFDEQFTITSLEELLSNINKLEYVKPETFNQIYSSGEVVSKSRILSNLKSSLLYKWLKLNGAIQTESFLKWVRVVNLVFYLLCYLTILIIVKRVFFRKRAFIEDSIDYALNILFFFISGYIVWLSLLSPLRTLFIIGIIATTLNLVLFWIKKALRKQ